MLINTQARAAKLNELVQVYRQAGLSAKQARKQAGVKLMELISLWQKQNKLYRRLDKEYKDLTTNKPCGKPAKSPSHVSSKAKQASNAAIVDTRGKGRNVVVYHGQQDGQKINLTITRKRDKQEAHSRLIKCQQAAKEVRRQKSKI